MLSEKRLVNNLRNILERYAAGKDSAYESIAKILGQIKKISPINIFTPDPKIKMVMQKDLPKYKEGIDE